MAERGKRQKPTEAMKQVAAHLHSDRMRAEVRREVERRRLTSCMNNTRWHALAHAVRSELPFAPAYQHKAVDQPLPEPEKFEPPVSYLGDWGYEGLYPFFDIEWLLVSPFLSTHRGMLIPPSITDCRAAFIAILMRERIPFVEEGNEIRIYGYIDPAAQ